MALKTKSIIFVAGTLCLLIVFAFFLLDQPTDRLAQLNSKYGLVAVELLDESVVPRVASLFRPDFLRANLIDLNKPRQELILKLTDEASSSSTDLQNVLILNLKTDENIEHIAEEYSNSKIVQYAEPNFDLEVELLPAIIDDSFPQVETSTEFVEPVIVAVLDSGVDCEHPDLLGRVMTGWNFLNDSTEVVDNGGHGTHTAGIILANSKSAKILPLKISDGSIGKIRTLVEAIKFATDHDAKIINLGLGLKQESQILREAIDYARAKDVFVVAAAGNYRSDTKYFPAAWSDVFAISGLMENGKKLFLSNFGEWIDFSVVAQDVSAPAPGGGYSFRTGTSQAAPFVSAQIADFLSTLGSIDFAQVEDFLIENSEPIDGKYLLGRQIFTIKK